MADPADQFADHVAAAPAVTERALLEERLQSADPIAGFGAAGGAVDGATVEAPASFAQARLWFLEQFQPGLAAYNMPSVLRVPGPRNVGTLEAALSELVRPHQALRTTFALRGGRAVQVVSPPAPPPLAEAGR